MEAGKLLGLYNSNRKGFFEEIRQTNLFIAVHKQSGGEMTLAVLQGNNKEQYIPTFLTREAEKGKFPDGELMALPFPLIRNLLVDLPETLKGLAINPFDVNIVLNREALSEFDSETQGMTVNREMHRNGVFLARAANLPIGLVPAVKSFCAEQLSINAAWVLLAKNAPKDKTHLMFAVDFYGSKIGLFPKLAQVIKPYMRPGEQFEIIEKQAVQAVDKVKGALVYSKAGKNVENGERNEH